MSGSRWCVLLAGLLILGGGSVRADDEAVLFTPAGFAKPGVAKTAEGPDVARIRIVVRDAWTRRPTPCRVNVVGPDGNFYQPAPNALTPFSLTGEWPNTGKGNRVGKAPFRYVGRFFYCNGTAEVAVPPGPVRIEAAKGFEYRPAALSLNAAAGSTRLAELVLDQPIPSTELCYYSGDPHLHFDHKTDADERIIFDLLEAEDIRYGSLLAYNHPPGPYTGLMERQDASQAFGVGPRSMRSQGDINIMSGQEYRSNTYGHLNLFGRDELVLKGRSVNANDEPPYGELGRETQEQGGYAFYAHGGYSQAIYADFAQKSVNGVELLQFGIYREIGLEDWYRILNIGYRFPCVGASDYPACRTLGDCRTYVESNERPDFRSWLRGAAEGRSFVTTGPLIRLEVEGKRPGSTWSFTGTGPHRVVARARVISWVAPVTRLHVIINGRVVQELAVPASQGLGNWLELEIPIELKESSWIAARAFSTSAAGSPDAESHTNPVYVYLDGKAPYNRADLDHLVGRLDGQIEKNRRREFSGKSKVLDDFERSRDILLRIRERGGLTADGGLEALIRESKLSLDPSRRTHTDEELKEFLRPLSPKSPAEALATFETLNGFHMELVAAEPMVHSPIAAAFDEDGNLYVAEMRDYPYLPKPGQKPLGSIRLLRDTDGDGKFDQAHRFAEELLWPGGVTPWKGGVFVTSPPDIWYLRDTDGDFRADVRRRVYTGFGIENMQAILNNLVFGLDHKISGSTSGNGGDVHPVDDPKAKPISLRKRDFRFDPVSGAFDSITGTVQFGNTFDDWGNRFLCSESHPISHVVLPQSYLERNPWLIVPSGIRDVAGGSVPIFRISPIERWRQIRSSRRIAHGERSATSAGASHHVVDAGAGVTVYRGSAYPESFYGSVFTGDAQNNLVHRQVLIPQGPTFASKRVDAGTEFVRSSDNWFRPVNLVNAPDGTLYVLDMSREVIEAIHIPLDVLKYLDLRRGREQGRIYRVAPNGFRFSAPPKLSRATTAELVEALNRRDAWWRDTAHRLIYERQDKSAVEPLRALLKGGPFAPSRLNALWSLEGLGALSDADLTAALADSAEGVRAHAIQLAEARLSRSPDLLAKILGMVDDPDVHVRFQLAFTLGNVNNPEAVVAMARIARRDAGDVWMRTALLSSSAHCAERFLAELLEEPTAATKPGMGELIEGLAGIVGARNRPDEWERVLTTISPQAERKSDNSVRERVLLGLGRGLSQAGAHLAIVESPATPSTRLIDELYRQATRTAEDDKAHEPERLRAIAFLGCVDFGHARTALPSLLEPNQPLAVQTASLRALAGFEDPEVAGILLERFAQFAPAVRAAALEVLLAREAWTLALLRAVDGGQALTTQIEPIRREALLKSRNSAIAELARKLFGSLGTSASRQSVLAAYAPVLKERGDSARGAAIFQRECRTCHKIGDTGHEVGPDLTTSSFRDPATLLTHILDPNQHVMPNYVQYLVADKSGRTFAGLIAAETATSLTLRRGEGAEDSLLRSEIAELVNTGKSLMPDGLESKIPPQEMADLLAYLVSVQGQGGAKVKAPRLDIGTVSGLVEPD
jgi:putative membrane-bound dehydrogenase-like protein